MSKDYNHTKAGGVLRDRAVMGVMLLSAVVTFAVYLPALGNGFVNWDDPTYIYKNPMIKSLDAALFKWAFTSVVSGNWHPLTLLSHAIDYAIFGPAPFGHHLSAIVIHGINTALVFLLSIKLICATEWAGGYKARAITASLTAALLFGLHPLHVESVAWISERKDILCALFFLISLCCYSSYALKRRAGEKGGLLYALTLGSFVLALLSKPMAVTLPVVLLILDIYPFGRLADSRAGETARTVILEKIPFFALSAATAVTAILTQKAGGAVGSIDAYPLVSRLAVASRAVIFYLYKALWPVKLAPYYPHPGKVGFFTSIEYAGSLLLIIAITAAAILLYKRYRVVAAAWAFYIVTLLPVAGIVQVGAMSGADRYSYITTLSIFLIIGLFVSLICEKLFKGRLLACVVVTAIVMALPLGALTVAQIGVWKDSVTLWSHEISLYPDSVPIAYTNRGIAYGTRGNFTDAIEDFTRAIEIQPEHAKAYFNRARAYSETGKQRLALTDLTTAIELKPRYANAYFNRGTAHANLGQYKEAIEDFLAVTELSPGALEAYAHAARAYALLGDDGKAAYYYKLSREIKE